MSNSEHKIHSNFIFCKCDKKEEKVKLLNPLGKSLDFDFFIL